MKDFRFYLKDPDFYLDEYLNSLWDKGHRSACRLNSQQVEELLLMIIAKISIDDADYEHLIEHKNKYIIFEIDKLFEKMVDKESWEHNIFRQVNEEYCDFIDRRYKAICC